MAKSPITFSRVPKTLIAINVLPITNNKNLYYCNTLSVRKSQETPKTTFQKYTLLAKSKAENMWEQFKATHDSNSLKRYAYKKINQLLEAEDYREEFYKSMNINLLNENKEFIFDVRVKHSANSSKDQIENELSQMIQFRIMHHSKWLKYSSAGIPVSAIVFIPIPLPNVLLFYNLYRVYCHYCCLKGVRNLNFLMANKLLHYDVDDIRSLDAEDSKIVKELTAKAKKQLQNKKFTEF